MCTPRTGPTLENEMSVFGVLSTQDLCLWAQSDHSQNRQVSVNSSTESVHKRSNTGTPKLLQASPWIANLIATGEKFLKSHNELTPRVHLRRWNILRSAYPKDWHLTGHGPFLDHHTIFGRLWKDFPAIIFYFTVKFTIKEVKKWLRRTLQSCSRSCVIRKCNSERVFSTAIEE